MRRLIAIAVLALLAVSASGCACVPCSALASLGQAAGGSAAAPGDAVGPQIQILSPLRGAMLTGEPRVRITGIASDASDVVALTVDGEAVTPDGSGQFAVDRRLRFGVNRFAASATDSAGNQSFVEWAYIWSPSYRPAEVVLPNAVTSRISRKALAAIPPPLADALIGKGVTRTDVYGDFPFTISLQPTAVVQGPDAITAVAEGRVLSASGTPIGQGPGFPSRDSATAISPRVEPRDLAIAIREDVVNQALYSAFARGNWNVRIDQAFLKSRGVELPFAFDPRLLVGLFPELAALAPPGAMLAIDVRAALPPVLDSRGQTSHPRISFGELQMAISIVTPQKQGPVLSVVAHFDNDISIGDARQCPSIRVSTPRDISISVLENPLGLSQRELDAFLATLRSGTALLYLSGIIKAIPVPLFDCYGLQVMHLWTVKTGDGSYLEIAGDLIRAK
jgi:hypothetical protein